MKQKLFLYCVFLCASFGMSQRPEFPPFIEPLWKLNVEKTECSSLTSQTVGEVIIYPEISTVRAVSIKTGKLIWQFDISCISDFSSQIYFGDSSVYILSSQTIYSLRAATGEQEWSYTFRQGNFRGFSYSKDWLFISQVRPNYKGTRVFAFNAVNGELIWKFEDEKIAYNKFEIVGQTIVSDVNGTTSYGGFGNFYLDLSTGEYLWGGITRGLGGREYVFYTDEKYGYRLSFHGGAPDLAGPIEQFDIRTGRVFNRCEVKPSPIILEKRYTDNNRYEYAFPFANRFYYGIEADGKWMYVQIGVDVHKLPLCGVTPVFPESSIETLMTRFGTRQGYLLPTLLFVLDWNYFTSKGESYPTFDRVGWVTRTSDNVFLLFYQSARTDLYGLYRLDSFPKNYLTLNNVGEVSSVEHVEPIILKHYEGIYTSLSRLDVIGELIFVGTVDGIFHVFDLHTQELIFRTRVNSPNFAPFHLVDDIAIVETLNGEVMAFKLDLPKQ